MISIYNKGITEKICEEFCDGYTDSKGNQIKGLSKWILKKVKTNLKDENLKLKKNSTNRKLLLELKIRLTEKEIKRILETKIDFLTDINNEYSKYDVDLFFSEKKDDKKNVLKSIFDYSGFRSYKSTFQNGYLLSQNLSVKCCPYCNRNYTSSHETVFYKSGELNDRTEAKYVFPEFDHFYPKEKYPVIAVSFYNLIPSCNICNSHYKNEKDPMIYNLFHPYREVSKNHFSFRFIPNSVSSLYGASDGFSLDFTYTDLDNINKQVKKSIEFFGIKENYENCHSNLIKEIVNKKISYSEKYLKSLMNNYGISREESYRILFETYYEENMLHKRPFSKLKKDIFDDIDIK